MKNSVFNRSQFWRLSYIFAFVLAHCTVINCHGQFLVGKGEEYATDIVVGAERIDSYVNRLDSKRVAVVGNQTSIVGEKHLVDTLLALGVEVVKAFAPEHGFRGTADAGEKVKDGKDPSTGIPVVSLYGNNRKPKGSQLEDVDIVLFDIQDVGARFYTYISTMHYVMEACAENNKKCIILDRPNPNGYYVDGPVLEKEFQSFVGMHPVPIVHGMTIGEYALMINGEHWLAGGVECDLEVVKCENYDHTKHYKLPVKPSPNLPNMSSIYLYPTLCLFEGTKVSVGRGTSKQFQVIGMPNSQIGDTTFTPRPMPGAKKPKHNGVACRGFDLSEFGEEYLKSFGELYMYWLVGMYENCPDQSNFFNSNGFFNLLCGTDKIKQMVIEGKSADEIQKSWREEVQSFKKIRSGYLLYPDFE